MVRFSGSNLPLLTVSLMTLAGLATTAPNGISQGVAAKQNAGVTATKSPKPVATATKVGNQGTAPATDAQPIKLTYYHKVGEVRYFQVKGFFSGQFPPFVTEGADSPPIHLLADLDYAATVKKMDDKGIEVEYSVERADLSLLEEAPPADGKIDPDKAAPFPIPLAQAQKLFNVTAVLRPNGSVAEIRGGDTSSIRINVGIDLRKLFLVTAPILFGDKPVVAGSEWAFDDGLLGHKPGKTTYKGTVEKIVPSAKDHKLRLAQKAEAIVENDLDAEGNSTDKKEQVVGTLNGKVTLSGAINMVAQNGNISVDKTSKLKTVSGTVSDGRMEMNAKLKRILPDPDMPGKKKELDINIKGLFFVRAFQSKTAKPADTKKPDSKEKPADTKPANGKEAKP